MSERMMPRFEKLYPEMRHDYRFLFSYAMEQYIAGRLNGALKTANECSALLADYNLCLLKGDIFRDMRQYNSALHYYNRAHEMCPSRFVPLYEMFNTYGMCGNKHQRKRMADEILAKPVKVRSREVDWILLEIRGEYKK